MSKLNVVIQNFLVLFFAFAFLGDSIIVGSGMFIDKFYMAIFYGVIIALTPNILKFFKLPVNLGSLFLISLIVTFIFLFLMISVFNSVNLTGRPINSGIELLNSLQLKDESFALVIISLVVSLGSIFMAYLKKLK